MAASWRTWESVLAIGNYLGRGQRTRQLTTLKLGDIDFSPPDFALYPYQGGLYVEGELPVVTHFREGGLVSLEGGRSLLGDPVGHVGVKLSQLLPVNDQGYFAKLQFRSVLTLSSVDRYVGTESGTYYPLCENCIEYPITSYTWETRNDPHTGVSLELGAFLGEKDSWQLGAGVRYLQNDIMQNDIDGKPEGVSGFWQSTFFY